MFSPNVIRSQLKLKSVKQRQIAKEAGVSESCVSNVISRKKRSKRIEILICQKIDLDWDMVFGGGNNSGK